MTKTRKSPLHPPGEGKSMKAALLETGAGILQSTTPLKRFDVYMVGLHCAKADPHMQMEAHHYCHQVNGEFLQCVLFDGNSKHANLIGIEYIISERLFAQLPPEERPYWHPHNYEILSGQLMAPGLSEGAEKAMMKLLMNSYGKTWHTWHSGRHDRPGQGDPLPLGRPQLMWSFNRDGESDPALESNREEALGTNAAHKRQSRQELTELAHPQHGVDTLKNAFPDAAGTRSPGVRDINDKS